MQPANRRLQNYAAYLLVGAAFSAASLAGVSLAEPYELSYGGRLTTGQDTPVVGPVDLELSFFRTSTAGTPILPAPLSFTAVALFDGVFQINLTMLSPADRHQIFSTGDDVWIEVRNVTNNAILPRQKYGAVPFALKVPVDGQKIVYNADGQLTLAALPSSASPGANNDITALSGLTTAITVAQGGTNANTASGARANLGAAASGVNNDITALNGLSTAVRVTQGGTGALDASGARANLGAAAKGANSDITALTGLTSAIALNQGGTGATTASTARANLGLGTAATADIGILPNNLVQLNGSALLPAVDGSLLTNLNAANLTGELPAISGANLTSLPAANLAGTLPALNGGNLTNLDASKLTNGNIPLSQLPAGTNGDVFYYNGGWQKLPIGSPGHVLSVSSANIPEWGPDQSSPSYKRRMSVLKNAGAATVATVGLAAAPTLGATATNLDDADGPQLNHATAASSGTSSGVISAAFTTVRRAWDPEYITSVKTDGTNTLLRYWVGFFSANLDAVTVPTTQHLAAFRYDTGADGTGFWRTVTGDGSMAMVTTTTAAIAPNTQYLLKISCSSINCKFYVNNALVATHTSSLPGLVQTMGYGNRVTTLSSSARSIRWGKIEILHK